MSAPILYCGDTHLRSAAAYLAGLLTLDGLTFQYVPSDRDLNESDLDGGPSLVILSDYPAARVGRQVQKQLAEQVRHGTGLLMIGGWESFHGLGGNWGGTPVADILPIEIGRNDDRLNSDRPLLVRRNGAHAITDNLPWERVPPYVGGLSLVTPASTARVVLEADRLCAVRGSGTWTFEIDATYPLLVVGEHGRGRTAALTTDVAPHWVGGLVDWGEQRVAAQANNADSIEVGDCYARFILQLVNWTKGE